VLTERVRLLKRKIRAGKLMKEIQPMAEVIEQMTIDEIAPSPDVRRTPFNAVNGAVGDANSGGKPAIQRYFGSEGDADVGESASPRGDVGGEGTLMNNRPISAGGVKGGTPREDEVVALVRILRFHSRQKHKKILTSRIAQTLNPRPLISHRDRFGTRACLLSDPKP
jgi:hypothetical protein